MLCVFRTTTMTNGVRLTVESSTQSDSWY